jgi:hypothetical protein
MRQKKRHLRSAPSTRLGRCSAGMAAICPMHASDQLLMGTSTPSGVMPTW